MSRKYQGLIILNTKSLDGTVDDLISAISKELETEGAKLEKITNLGRRQFAHNSQHLEAGQYVNYDFESTPDTIVKIKARLSLNDHVYLQYFQRSA